MPISVECTCGKAFRVKDEFAGKKIRCTTCKQVITVPAPEPELTAEDEATAFLLTEDASPPPPPASKAKSSTDIQERPPTPKNDDRVTEKPPPPKPAAKESKKGGSLQKLRWSKFDDGREREPSRRGLSLSPTLVTGLLMMVGAVVWFVAGLALGIFFIYPPILFVLGICAVFLGAMGHED